MDNPPEPRLRWKIGIVLEFRIRRNADQRGPLWRQRSQTEPGPAPGLSFLLIGDDHAPAPNLP